MGSSIGVCMSLDDDPDDNGEGKVSEKSIQAVMPSFYASGRPTQFEITVAENSWKLISSSKGAHFLNVKKISDSVQFDYETCRDWFESMLFFKLFELAPLTRRFFYSPETQKRFVDTFINFILSNIRNDDEFYDGLVQVAENHCKRGIKAKDFSYITEAFLWGLEEVLGSDFDFNASVAWKRIFSWVLGVVIPIALLHTMKADQNEKFDENCLINPNVSFIQYCEERKFVKGNSLTMLSISEESD